MTPPAPLARATTAVALAFQFQKRTKELII
jgi:hypothetical protein